MQATLQDATSEAATTLRLRGDSMPKGERSVSNAVDKYRQQLETAVTQKYGSVSVVAAGLIQAACRMESLAKRWSLRRKRQGASWSPETALKVDSFIATRTSDRCRLVAQLGIDDVAEGSVASLYQDKSA